MRDRRGASVRGEQWLRAVLDSEAREGCSAMYIDTQGLELVDPPEFPFSAEFGGGFLSPVLFNEFQNLNFHIVQ